MYLQCNNHDYAKHGTLFIGKEMYNVNVAWFLSNSNIIKDDFMWDYEYLK